MSLRLSSLFGISKLLHRMPLSRYSSEIQLDNKLSIGELHKKQKIKCKFIFITGGVISSVGKGVATSFLGAVMKGHGYNVTAIKIDPYINIDAGTFSPYEHGEVFVLDDGSEVDLDLGNYERMIDIRLNGKNNITTGKIYDYVIKKERKGDYLGKTVQIIPHVTDQIQNWLLDVANDSLINNKNEEYTQNGICLVEVGGTIGDIESMPFLEAIRQLQTNLHREDYCHIHVSLLPISTDNQHKTKPTQHSVKEMRSCGLYPDFIFCRSDKDINDSVKTKLSLFCDTPLSYIINLPNMNNIYGFFPILYQQNIVQNICLRLNLPLPKESSQIKKWLEFSAKCENVDKDIVIAVVGKYTTHRDAYHSVSTALSHASINLNRKLVINWIDSDSLDKTLNEHNEVKYLAAWEKLKFSHGILIPGGFDKRGVSGKIIAANYGRVAKVPTFGICLGFQTMIIEYARNILKLPEADSTEINASTPNPVVIEMPEFNPLQKGGTMRLGLRKTIFTSNECRSTELYETKTEIYERHRHRYEFNIEYKQQFEQNELKFVGEDETGTRMEILELPQHIHPFYIGVQYHPEFLSRPLSPAPLFKGFIQSAILYDNPKD